MKGKLIAISTVLLAVFSISPVFAQQGSGLMKGSMKGNMMDGKQMGMMKEGMGSKENMMGVMEMCPMGHMMMKSMIREDVQRLPIGRWYRHVSLQGVWQHAADGF